MESKKPFCVGWVNRDLNTSSLLPTAYPLHAQYGTSHRGTCGWIQTIGHSLCQAPRPPRGLMGCMSVCTAPPAELCTLCLLTPSSGACFHHPARSGKFRECFKTSWPKWAARQSAAYGASSHCTPVPLLGPCEQELTALCWRD